MKKAAKAIFSKNKFLLALGGDHAVSLGPIMAAAEVYPDLGILQIDAHLDLRDEWNGSPYNHACVMRRVVDDVNLPVVPVGTRAFSKAEAVYARNRNLKPFYAHQLDPIDDAWVSQVPGRLPKHVYLTIDLDGLDPAVLPGTGTPEPGGLSYRQLVQLIKTIGVNRTVVGADVVELTKLEGSQVSEYTAAKIITKILIYCLGRGPRAEGRLAELP